MKANGKSLKKSMSLGGLKLKFDTKDMQIGSSKIDRLPIRKKSMQQHISNDVSSQHQFKREKRIQTQINYVQKLKYQIEMMKRVNQSLERQNEILKKQVSFLNQTATSKRSSFCVRKTTEQSGYKQKILSRLNNKRDGILTDNESTGLFSSKNMTSRMTEQTQITELYEDFTKKRIIPSIEYLYEVSKKYFNEYKQNYLKLKIVYDNMNNQIKTEISKKVEDLLCLFQVPILFKQNPRGLFKSISKQKLTQDKKQKFQNSKMINKKDEFCAQLKSPIETLNQLQKLIKIVMKSPKMLEKFRASQTFMKLIQKCKQH